MLINKGISVNQVVTIVLQSGIELMARLVDETDNHYVLSKPHALTASQHGIGLTPMIITVNPSKDVSLVKSSVAVIAESDKEFSDQYVQRTTGIALS